MKNYSSLALFLAGLLLAGCSTPTTAKNNVTAADITVVFQAPENFRDVRDSLGGSTDENALADLRAYLQREAPAHLQSGQKLKITFTDIDLAGDFVPGINLERIRIIKPIYFPRQEFTFAVTDAGGGIVKQGNRILADMDYLTSIRRIGSNEAYFHDKLLLEDWLRDEFK